MFTEADARRVLAAADVDGPDVLVLDLRTPDEPREWLVFRRAWAAGGVRVAAAPAAADWPFGLQVPVVALTPAEPPAGFDPFATVGDRASEVRVVRAPVAADEPEPFQRVMLWVFGRGLPTDPGTTHVAPYGLPHRVCAARPLYEPAALVHVAGSDGLPAGGWFRLPPWPGGDADRDALDELRLTIDATPRLGGADRWAVSADAGPCTPLRTPTPPPLTRLIVVFDRTCPDADRWDAARLLAKAARPAAAPAADAALYGNVGSAPPPATAGPALEELNAGVRAGLVRGLAGLGDVRVQVVWFADVAGDGLVLPPWLTNHPTEATGEDAAARAPAAVVVDTLTYAPGLDLWDPVDAALRRAARLAGADGTAAVLVVGNSPPHMPHRAVNPFRRVIAADGGVPSGFRRRGVEGAGLVDFETVLADLDRAGVRVGYLFLGGHRAGGPSGERFRTVQDRVREALGECRLQLTEADATEAGVAAGVREAVDRLRDEVSRVRVWAGGKP